MPKRFVGSIKKCNFVSTYITTSKNKYYIKKMARGLNKGWLTMAMLLIAITSQAQLKRIVFTPQWDANSQFAGYIAARELGYYEDEGLEVTIKYPGGSLSSTELLRDGKADLVTSALTSAIAMKANEGIDLVNVMQTSQHSAICLALKKPVENLTAESLRGMRVGLWYSKLAIAAEVLNIQKHLRWTEVLFRRGFKLLDYGVLDAITVMEYNELLQLKYSGHDVSKHSVLRLCESNYDVPEDGIYCLNDYFKLNAKEVRAFVKASKKGWAWCRKHPKEAADYVIEEMTKEKIVHSKVTQLEGLKIILKKQEVTPGKVSYQLNQAQFEQAANFMQAAGIITTNPDFKTFIAR